MVPLEILVLKYFSFLMSAGSYDKGRFCDDLWQVVGFVNAIYLSPDSTRSAFTFYNLII